MGGSPAQPGREHDRLAADGFRIESAQDESLAVVGGGNQAAGATGAELSLLL